MKRAGQMLILRWRRERSLLGDERPAEPSEDAGGVAVHVAAHDAVAARYPHDYDEEGCGGCAVDDRHQNKQLDRVDVQEAQRRADDCAQRNEAVENKGFARGPRGPHCLPGARPFAGGARPCRPSRAGEHGDSQQPAAAWAALWMLVLPWACRVWAVATR